MKERIYKVPFVDWRKQLDMNQSKYVRHQNFQFLTRLPLTVSAGMTASLLMLMIQDINPPATYQILLDMGWAPNKNDFTVTNPEGIAMRILNVEHTSQATTVTMEAATPAVSIFNVLDKIKEKLSGFYKNVSLLQSRPLHKN